MTYDEALAYLSVLTNYEQTHQPEAMRTMPLSRMRALCERLGNPQTKFRSVLVAGTNGKGSICAMIYEILRAASLPVGLYTSPHLEDLRERIRVQAEVGSGESGGRDLGSDWISPEALAGLVERMRPVVETFRGAPEGPLTYFEVLTAAAFLYFAEQRVRVAVLEVGLGGRLDATNVVEPAVSVIGPIGLDHTDVLGERLVTIAREKAGVMRTGLTVITAAQPPEVASILREMASTVGCRLVACGQEVEVDVLNHDATGGLQVAIRGTRGRYEPLRLSLLGRHQAQNALMAIAAVEALSLNGAPYSAVRAGLATTRWPGRLEVVQDRPVVLLDGAHNPQAARALADTLRELWPNRRTHLVLGMSRDKPLQAVAEPLMPLAASVTCTRSRHPRACEPQELAQRLNGLTDHLTVMPDVVDACTYLLNTVDPEDLIVVTGSLFLVGELRTALTRPGARPDQAAAMVSE